MLEQEIARIMLYTVAIYAILVCIFAIYVMIDLFRLNTGRGEKTCSPYWYWKK